MNRAAHPLRQLGVTVAATLGLLALSGCGRQPATSAPTPTGAPAASGEDAKLAEALRALSQGPLPPLPPLNPAVIDRLAQQQPELASVREELAELESRAIANVVTQPASAQVTPAPLSRDLPWTRALAVILDGFVPQARAAGPAIADVPGLASMAPGLSSLIFTRMMADVPDRAVGARPGEARRSDIPGPNRASATLAVEARDGRTSVSLATQVEAQIFLLEAGSKITLETRSLCPDAEGHVEFTIRLEQKGQAGTGGRVRHGGLREARVHITVDEQAGIAGASMDARTSESFNADGRPVFIEEETRWTAGAGGEWNFGDRTVRQLSRASQQATQDDQRELEEAWLQTASLGESAADAA